MKHIRKELTDFQVLFAILSVIGLIAAMAGTTYTNYDSLASKFPALICFGVCLAITLGFTLPLYLEWMPLLMRAVIVLIMFISTSLAINTMASKEITNAETRLVQDETYRRLKLDYLTKSNQLQKAFDANIANVKQGYTEGAKSARLAYEQLKKEKDVAKRIMDARADSLQTKGSIQQEAYVETWYTLASNAHVPVVKNFDKKAIEVTSTLIFSVICDNLIVIFSYIIVCLLGENVIIHNFRKDGFFKRVFKKKTENENVKNENETENENQKNENENENVGRDFQKSGSFSNKLKAEKMKMKIKKLSKIENESRPSKLSKILNTKYHIKITPQRVGQILKDK